MSSKTIFISADHGLALIYFLQSEVVPRLVESGRKVVVLVEDGLRPKLAARWGRPGLIFEGLREDQTSAYFRRESHELQWWLQFLRRVGGSNGINTKAMDSYVRQVAVEEPIRRLVLMPLAWPVIGLLRRSASTRERFAAIQSRFTPSIYADLFERYRPELVVGSTPGWRLDRYLLREAARRGVLTATVIVGWDNPSSYGLPGAPVDWVTCWSEIQKQELIVGSDWLPERVNIGGMPSYDGYFRQEWLMSREEYYRTHGLDPNRRLLSYACSFVSFAPNLRNVKTLAKLVSQDGLGAPSQLLVRLHPNHFWNVPFFAREREAIRQLARELPHVHVVEPVPLGGNLGYYSGEDMPEKSSMMAYSDVFLTVYSTMVVEAAIHGRPIVSLCLDTPGGWGHWRKYSLPLSRIGSWPTHDRFRRAGAGPVVQTELELRDAIDLYLESPDIDSEQRRKFVEREVTFTDGSAGRRTGEYLFSLS